MSLKKKFGEALDEGNTEGAELIKTFKDQIYVDGSIVGYDDGKEVVRLYHEFKQIFADASFNTPALRSNMKRSYEPIPAKDSEIGSIQKVLGIKWQRQTDQLELRFTERVSKNELITKSKILCRFAQNYVPLGVLAQEKLKAKISVQSMWIFLTTLWKNG